MHTRDSTVLAVLAAAVATCATRGGAATAPVVLFDFERGMPRTAEASSGAKIVLEPAHDGTALRIEGGPSRR